MDDDQINVDVEIVDEPKVNHRQTKDVAEESYGARATKRINQLSSRAKAAEDRDARSNAEIVELRKQLHHQAVRAAGADEEALQARVVNVQRVLRVAKESGDLDAEIKATDELMDLRVSLRGTMAAKAQVNREINETPAEANKTSLAMQSWLDDDGNNEWFKKDQPMTLRAVELHNEAVGKNIRPESRKYFDYIDKKMKEEFSDYFNDGEDGPEVEVVETPVRAVVAAPARRTTSPATPTNRPGTIRLSSEELEVAKALGMTPQQYAANKSAK